MRNKKNETAKYRRDKKKKKKKKACKEAKNTRTTRSSKYSDTTKQRTDHSSILIHRKMEKANQDEEKGYGSTQTQEEEGKAARVEAPWHNDVRI